MLVIRSRKQGMRHVEGLSAPLLRIIKHDPDTVKRMQTGSAMAESS